MWRPGTGAPERGRCASKSVPYCGSIGRAVPATLCAASQSSLAPLYPVKQRLALDPNRMLTEKNGRQDHANHNESSALPLDDCDEAARIPSVPRVAKGMASQHSAHPWPAVSLIPGSRRRLQQRKSRTNRSFLGSYSTKQQLRSRRQVPPPPPLLPRCRTFQRMLRVRPRLRKWIARTWHFGMCSSTATLTPRHSHSHRSDSQPSRPGPQKTPSFPTTSLAERMAALRASGLSGATTGPAGPGARRTAVSPPRSPDSLPSPPISGPSRTLRQSATPISPSTSPRVQKGDLVADDAVERSGSAPPILPYSQVQEPAKVWEESALQFRPDGGAAIDQRENGVSDRGPAGGVDVAPSRSRAEEDEPASPTQFESAFPSLDDFEKRIDPADLGNMAATRTRSSTVSSDTFQLPSVPTSDPGSAPASSSSSSNAGKPTRRAPPPHPPKPQYLDEQTFRREQQQRADQMAKHAAGLNNTPLSTAPTAPGRVDVPSVLVPGRRSSATTPASPVGAGQVAPPLPVGPRKGLKIPFATEVRPLELWQYIQTSQAEDGEGPRVLLLDVRSREEYERGRVRGESVCLEPIVFRNGCVASEVRI